MAGLILYLWNRDRVACDKRYEALVEASDKRYECLAQDFRKIVQENTAAVVSLREALTGDFSVREAMDLLRKGKTLRAPGGSGE